jgi:dynein assembly factor 5
MRLHFITLLIRLLVEAPATLDSQHQFTAFASRVLSEILIPNCVWRAGRTAAAIRTASMTCVQALLQGRLLTPSQLSLALDDLLPKVVSCLDDTNQSTRLVSCKVLQLLLTERHLWENVDRLHQLHSDLLKRLDDNSDEVRIAVSKTLVTFASAFPAKYERDLYKAHTEDLYKGLLVHLDDPSSLIQEGVLGVLKEACRLNPDLLREQLDDVKHRHREDRYCEELLEFMGQNC